MLGVLPGYYNSAWGITITGFPTKSSYISYGLYDGNLARGVQTGIRVGPTINSYTFQIAEAGNSWEWGKQKNRACLLSAVGFKRENYRNNYYKYDYY